MSSNSKVLLLTGGNTGLGYATVAALLQGKNEYHIILTARSQDKADEAVHKLQGEHPGSKSKLTGMIVDYTSDSDIENLVNRVTKEVGRLDILVNNGGGMLDVAYPHMGLSERQMWAASRDLNVTGPYLLTKAFAPLLLKSSDPRVLFITSGLSSLSLAGNGHGLNTVPAQGWPKDPMTYGAPAYAAVKTGLNQVMCQLGRIFKQDNVKVQAVQPGFLASNLGGVGPDVMRQMGARPVEEGGDVIRGAIEGERDEDAAQGVINPVGTQPW